MQKSRHFMLTSIRNGSIQEPISVFLPEKQFYSYTLLPKAIVSAVTIFTESFINNKKVQKILLYHKLYCKMPVCTIYCSDTGHSGQYSTVIQVL